MIRVKPAEEVVYERRDTVVKKGPQMAGYGTVLGGAKYFGDSASLERGPQGFLVDYGPNFRIDPHFHLVDQYQIFCRGKAQVGHHEAVPYTVHYADAYLSYGPIIGTEEGFAFYNFRSRADTGAHIMPGSRDEIVRKGTGRYPTETTRLTLADAGKTIRAEWLIEPYDDGLATSELVAGAGSRLADEVVKGSCRYELVIDGVLEYNGKRLAKNSCILAMGGDMLADRRAGPEGVHLLQLQLPHGG